MEKYRVRSRWCKMLSRCEDEDNPQWSDYGGGPLLGGGLAMQTSAQYDIMNTTEGV